MIAHSASSGPGGNREPIDTSIDRSKTVHISRLVSVILARYQHRMKLFWSHSALNDDFGPPMCKKNENHAAERPGQHQSLTTKFRCESEFWCHMTGTNENPSFRIATFVVAEGFE